MWCKPRLPRPVGTDRPAWKGQAEALCLAKSEKPEKQSRRWRSGKIITMFSLPQTSRRLIALEAYETHWAIITRADFILRKPQIKKGPFMVSKSSKKGDDHFVNYNRP